MTDAATPSPPGDSSTPTPSSRGDLDRSAELDRIGERARTSLDGANRVREEALDLSRELIRTSANSIRATHREDRETAEALLRRAEALSAQLIRVRDDRADIFYAGYVQDALKEFAEARCVFALVNHQPILDADHLGIPWPAFLNGLGEAIGELRRHCLDLLRRRDVVRAEGVLENMDTIFSMLVTMDYPDAITAGLRRTADNMRGILERTRADLTTAVLQQRLATELNELGARLSPRLAGEDIS